MLHEYGYITGLYIYCFEYLQVRQKKKKELDVKPNLEPLIVFTHRKSQMVFCVKIFKLRYSQPKFASN